MGCSAAAAGAAAAVATTTAAAAEASASAFGGSYLALVQCGHAAGALALAALIALAFYLLGSTAERFFSPTLAAMCDRLRLSPELAGVTLLALGNGSPDVFASIASVGSARNGRGPELGISALLGAAMFLLTVVLGSVCYTAPAVAVSRYSFVRDVAFFLTVLAWIVGWSWTGEPTSVGVALGYLALYATYVTVVFMQEWYLRSDRRRCRIDPAAANTSLVDTDDSAGASFWHRHAREPLLDGDHLHGAGDNAGALCQPLEIAGAGPPALIIDDYFCVPDVSPDDAEAASRAVAEELYSCGASDASSANGYTEAGADGASDSDVVSTATSASIEENDSNATDWPASSSCAAASCAGDHRFIEEQPARPQRASRLATNRRQQSFMQRLRHTLSSSTTGAFFWRKLSLQRAKSARAGLGTCATPPSEGRQLHLSCLIAKALRCIELPFNLLRRATIPNIRCKYWSKPLTVAQPFLCGFFLLFASHGIDSVSPEALGMLASAMLVLSLGLYFTLHRSQPPTSNLLCALLLSAGFASCVGWIYFVADELVAMLNAVGYISGVNKSILGLTVLAMGNSAGDLVANTAIARSGMANMAIAGCFGAPLLNILLGLGIGFLVMALRAQEPIVVVLDGSCLLTAAFLTVTLLFVLCSVAFNDYVVPRFMPPCLFVLYVLYITASLTIGPHLG